MCLHYKWLKKISYQNVLIFNFQLFSLLNNGLIVSAPFHTVLDHFFVFKPAFSSLHFPGWWFRRFRKPHVILGIDPELILPSRHDINGSEFVIEETVCHDLPSTLDRITLGDHVVQPVIFLLIWRGIPGDRHCSRHILIQLHWAWRLGVIYKQVGKNYMCLDVLYFWLHW